VARSDGGEHIGGRLESGVRANGCTGHGFMHGWVRSKAGARAHPSVASTGAGTDGVNDGVNRGGRRSSVELGNDVAEGKTAGVGTYSTYASSPSEWRHAQDHWSTGASPEMRSAAEHSGATATAS